MSSMATISLSYHLTQVLCLESSRSPTVTYYRSRYRHKVTRSLKNTKTCLRELPGEYKIITDERVKPKVHPPRRVPVAVRPKIKEKLDAKDGFYLDCVKETQGCPILVRSDCGTENGIMTAMQCFFHQNGDDCLAGDKAHKYGSSPANQKTDSGRRNLTTSPATKLLSTLPSDDTVGFECLLASVLLQKYGKEPCTNLWRGSKV